MMMGRHRDPQLAEDAGQAARWRHLNIVRPHLAKHQAMAVVTNDIGQMSLNVALGGTLKTRPSGMSWPGCSRRHCAAMQQNELCL
jgi:hypothetical protein